MGILKMDSRRRVTLPKQVVDDPEQEFVAIKVKEGILLKPLPKDPIKALEEEGKKLPKDLTIKEMKKMAAEEALEEVKGDLRRNRFLSGDNQGK